MNSPGRDTPVFALVVYAKRNVRDMAEKAFRSISQQRRKPDKLIVVDDQSESGFEDVKERVIDLRVDGCHVQVLRNERTQGLCGALNTALLKLMEYADERGTYVTFMREEDWLCHDHFLSIERVIKSTDCDLVLSDVNVEGRVKPIKMDKTTKPSGHLARLFGLDLDVASCLLAAPAVRLEALLEAGLFNEALQGMQLHELLLRLSELPDLRWGATGKPTLKAPPSGYRKDELNEAVILSMRRGSRTFCLLARHRLDSKTEDALHKAIRQRRDRRDPNTPLLRWGVGYDLLPSKARKLKVAPLSRLQRRQLASKHIVVGVISRSNQTEAESGLPTLLKDLGWLAGHVASIHVEVLDNADRGCERYSWFDALVRAKGRLTVNISKGDFARRDATAKGFQASIATARAEIQRKVALRIRDTRGRYGAFAWFVDEDLSLVNRAMCWNDSESRRWFLGQLASLIAEADQSSRTEPTMILGQVTDAPPIPGTMTYRLQLLDAVTAVRGLRQSKLANRYRYRDFQRVLEKWVSPGRPIRDFYYDVSSRDLVHLEFPFDFFPWDNGEFPKSRLSNRGVMAKLVAEIPKLAKGKQVFRPIFADRHFAVSSSEMKQDGLPAVTRRPRISSSPSVLRGGNTVIPSGKDSHSYPTVTLEGLRDADGNPMTPRRADMVSAVICRYLHGRQVVACSLPVRQRREDEGNQQTDRLLNPRKYIPDTEGFAIYSALKAMLDDRQLARLDTKLGKEAKEDCSFTEADIAKFSTLIDEFRKSRTRAIIASFYRIRGLAKVLQRELSIVGPEWFDGHDRDIIDAALRFSNGLERAIPRGFDCVPGSTKKILSSPPALQQTDESKRMFLADLGRHRAKV